MVRRVPKILLSCPDPKDGTSIYRGWGPYGALDREGAVQVTHCPINAGWVEWATNDVLVLQRPHTPQEVRLAQQAKLHGLKVICDWDDDLLHMRTWSPRYNAYTQPDVQNSIKRLAAVADVVTVPTAQLKRVFKQYNKKTVVVPNALDNRICHAAPSPSRASNNICAWRGAGTHARDFDGILPAFEKVVKENADWKFAFFGSTPWPVLDALGDSIRSIGPVPNTEFLTQFRDIAPDILIVPLRDEPFNRAKSNLAWLDATQAGAAVLAPDWEEWRRPGVTTYKDEKDFEKKLRRMLQGEVPLRQLALESWQYIQAHLTLSKVNEQRLSIINELLQKVS